MGWSEDQKEIRDFWTEVYPVRDAAVSQKLMDQSVIWNSKKGDYIAKAKEPIQEVSFLIDGIAKEIRENTDRIAMISTGRGFLLRCTELTTGKYESPALSVVSITECRLLSIPLKVWKECIDRSIDAMMILIKNINRFSKINAERNKHISTDSSREKLEWFLGLYPEIAGKMAKKDVAAFLAIKPETFSRTLKSLKEEKG